MKKNCWCSLLFRELPLSSGAGRTEKWTPWRLGHPSDEYRVVGSWEAAETAEPGWQARIRKDMASQEWKFWLTRNSSVLCQALEIAAAAADQRGFACTQHKRQCRLDARILGCLVIIFCQGVSTKQKERYVFSRLFCFVWKWNGLMATASTYLRITSSFFGPQGLKN